MAVERDGSTRGPSKEKEKTMLETYFRYFGSNGVITPIGMVVFVVTYNYANDIFTWIEDQTFGTRNYILDKFELMFIEVEPRHITYVLLFLSFGIGSFVFGIFAFFGKNRSRHLFLYFSILCGLENTKTHCGLYGSKKNKGL